MIKPVTMSLVVQAILNCPFLTVLYTFPLFPSPVFQGFGHPANMCWCFWQEWRLESSLESKIAFCMCRYSLPTVPAGRFVLCGSWRVKGWAVSQRGHLSSCHLWTPPRQESWGLMDALESNWEASLSLGWGRSLTAQCSWKLRVQEPAWGCSWGCSWEPRQGTGHHSLHWHRIFLRVGITHWWMWEFGIFSTMLT